MQTKKNIIGKCMYICWLAVLMEKDHLVFQEAFVADYIFKNVLANMSINSREGVIQKVDVLILVDSPGQSHTLLLTS